MSHVYCSRVVHTVPPACVSAWIDVWATLCSTTRDRVSIEASADVGACGRRATKIRLDISVGSAGSAGSAPLPSLQPEHAATRWTDHCCTPPPRPHTHTHRPTHTHTHTHTLPAHHPPSRDPTCRSRGSATTGTPIREVPFVARRRGAHGSTATAWRWLWKNTRPAAPATSGASGPRYAES